MSFEKKHNFWNQISIMSTATYLLEGLLEGALDGLAEGAAVRKQFV